MKVDHTPEPQPPGPPTERKHGDLDAVLARLAELVESQRADLGFLSQSLLAATDKLADAAAVLGKAADRMGQVADAGEGGTEKRDEPVRGGEPKKASGKRGGKKAGKAADKSGGGFDLQGLIQQMLGMRGPKGPADPRPNPDLDAAFGKLPGDVQPATGAGAPQAAGPRQVAAEPAGPGTKPDLDLGQAVLDRGVKPLGGPKGAGAPQAAGGEAAGAGRAAAAGEGAMVARGAGVVAGAEGGAVAGAEAGAAGGPWGMLIGAAVGVALSQALAGKEKKGGDVQQGGAVGKPDRGGAVGEYTGGDRPKVTVGDVTENPRAGGQDGGSGGKGGGFGDGSLGGMGPQLPNYGGTREEWKNVGRQNLPHASRTLEFGFDVFAAKSLPDAILKVGNFAKVVEQASEHLLQINKQYAEHSAYMGQVFAEAEARDAFRDKAAGDRLSRSARSLMESDQSRKDSTAEWSILAQKIENYLQTVMNKVVDIHAFALSPVAKAINKYLDEDETTEGALTPMEHLAEIARTQEEERKRDAEARRRRL